MGKVLEARNLQINRDGQTLLDVDHLALEEGEMLAVIGPNGAGKSTLLLALSCLWQPDSGSILFHGRLIEPQDGLSYRRRIGLVLQEPLLMDVSVFDNVAMGLRFRGLRKDEIRSRVEEWLDRLGIGHLKKRRARRLSGGEAQRVSLARAFAIQPEILFLDEPFSALDKPTRSRLLEDIHGLLRETDITTFFITHDLDEALYLGHRVAVLLDGRLRQSGSPQEVISAPADRDVAAFVGVETVIAGEVISSHKGHLVIQADGKRLSAIGDVESGRMVFLCLRPEDITLEPGDQESRQSGFPKSSARNRLEGHIQRTIPQGPLVRVLVDCDCSFPVVALVTRLSVEEMGLAAGKPVTATFKASAVHLIPR